ncbi:MAG TPA: VOC family protein [Candidatus Bathyarchaeia archaeon]|nr:VOC family protein [Candidatus Bathyarchaeia archaeon]
MNNLSGDNLKRVTQIAIVVKDIEKAIAIWSELLGLEKPSIAETEDLESTRMTFRGKPSKGKAKLAFLNLENIEIELIQPVDGPSTWQDFLDRHGEGIHHIAFHVENLEETLERFRKMGIRAEQKGDFKGGCYVYTDSKSELGAIIELLHMHA